MTLACYFYSLYFQGCSVYVFGFFMESSSVFGVNYVSLGSMLSVAPVYGMCCKISIQLGGIVPYIINGTVDNL